MLLVENPDTVFLFRVQKGFQNLQQSMQAAPDKVGESAAMPETADQKGDQQIQTMPESADAVAAERNINIVPEPCGQGNVPSAPEFFDAERKVRTFEVCHQFYAEQSCTADRNVGIS